jgi:hypothetical protein
MNEITGIIASGDGRKPNAPTIGTATGGNASASITFSAPAFLGKGTGTNTYTMTSTPGNFTGSGVSSPISVTGLANGTAYTFKVKVSNGVLTSDESAASNSVTPVAPPFFPPFFPPYFPFFPGFGPFFPPYFPFFPGFGPFFPPYFPFFPPSFKSKCIHENAQVLTSNGYVSAKDIKVGDKLVTVNPNDLTNYVTFVDATIKDNVTFVKTEVLSTTLEESTLVKFNNSETMFAPTHPVFVKENNNIVIKNAGDIVVGDLIVNVYSENGQVAYIAVEDIEVFESANVYDIKTTPFKWYIVGNYLTIA